MSKFYAIFTPFVKNRPQFDGAPQDKWASSKFLFFWLQTLCLFFESYKSERAIESNNEGSSTSGRMSERIRIMKIAGDRGVMVAVAGALGTGQLINKKQGTTASQSDIAPLAVWLSESEIRPVYPHIDLDSPVLGIHICTTNRGFCHQQKIVLRF